MNTKRPFLSFVSIINALILLISAVACNYQNKSLDDGLNSLIKTLEKSNIAEKNELKLEAQNLIKSQRSNFTRIEKSEKLVGVFNNKDTDKAVHWIKTNESTMTAVIERMKKGIEQEITDINALSKSAYLEKDREAAGFKYALVYYRLQYFKNNLSVILENLAPLSMIVHSTALVDDESTLEFRKNLEKELLKMVGVGIVVNGDISKIKDSIKTINDVQPLAKGLKDGLLKSDQAILKASNDKAKRYELSKEQCKENPAVCEKLDADRATLMAEFENVTFLYTPGNKYFLITKLLTIIGNLTWGLANTVIGAGVVLVTMAVSPFTPYVDFPTFNIAASGMQIYVDVTGMSPIPGKMSLGLFELDNATWYEFESDHEAGHAIQSAILGPFYLPTVIMSYIISGHHGSFMERLADIKADASDRWL